jgi:hypothetical protein
LLRNFARVKDKPIISSSRVLIAKNFSYNVTWQASQRTTDSVPHNGKKKGSWITDD